MTHRAVNFCAGPCTLPLTVLEEAQAEFVDYQGTGMSLLEMSHRGKEYDAVHQEARSLALELAGAPDGFDALFIQGGATLQFAMVPMNFLAEGARGAYVNSGSWAQGAIADARHYGDIYLAWDGEAESYMRMPGSHEITIGGDTRFLHITSNETIGGVRFAEWPDVGVPLIADMSSEFLARPIPWQHFDLVYGGVQKNLGPSGAALVFIRESILPGLNSGIARYLTYAAHSKARSLFNTPPVFVVYMIGKVLKWMKAQGGVEAMERSAAQKAGLIYGVIDGSGGFYRCPVDVACRSHMNVVFRLPDEALETRFLQQAADHELLNLKGHRSVGGCRASIYNAMPPEGVRSLVSFMEEFRRVNG